MKRCIRCGIVFDCGPALGSDWCWCAELPPIMPVTDEGCLCKSCLQEEMGRRLCGKSSARASAAVEKAGLCAGCRHARKLRTKGGSNIYLCRLSEKDAGFAKYPRLPVLKCVGYSRTRLIGS